MSRLVVVVLALTACGAAAPSPFAVSFAEAERTELAGRHAEAAEAFDQAAAAAKSPKEKEDAQYRAALERIAAGDVATGAQALAVIAAGSGDHAPDAALKHAELLLATHDPEAATELDAFVKRFPQNGLAPRALALRLRLEDEKGVDATLAYLATLEQPLTPTELGANVAYEEARRIEAKGDLEGAHARYVLVAAKWPYPVGALFDDALWRASLCAEKLGKPDVAAKDLESMLEVREESQLNGSYDRPRFPDSMLRLASLYETGLHDDKKAKETYRRFRDTFTRSPRIDMAMWNEARLTRQDGDAEGACSELGKLVDRFPDSRYVPCALEKCTTLVRPKESHAPATCHPYLER